MVSTATQTAISRNVQLSNLIQAQFSSGKVALPLQGSLYTSFEHVKGVPSPDAGGYSLSKLQLIDLMVRRLVQLRSDDSLSLSSLTAEATADGQIHDLSAQITHAIDRADVGVGTFAVGIGEPGLFFNAVA